MQKQAGEVRFIKDRSGDSKEWAWTPPGASERTISENFVFNAKQLKPLALSLRSALMALGHVTSAHARFVKIKSRNVSPDGSLGGMGYIQKISDMRRQLMNCIEVLSAYTDTLYDELNAPHWYPAEDKLTPRDREEVKQIVEEAEEIKDDPEQWAEEAEEELSEEPIGKTASLQTVYSLFRGVGSVDTVKPSPVIKTFLKEIGVVTDDLDLQDPVVYSKVTRVLASTLSQLSNIQKGS